MNNYMKHILLASFFLVLICSYAYAESEDIEGYDENTEIKVTGVVADTLPRMRGAIIAILKSGKREYRVVTGPQRYLLQEGFVIKAGDSWQVTGSKLISRDGSLYIIARKVKNISTGRKLLLRDTALIPLWRGGPHRMGPHHMGPSQGEPRYRDNNKMRDRD